MSLVAEIEATKAKIASLQNMIANPLQESFDNCFFIYGLPTADVSKRAALQKVLLTKLFKEEASSVVSFEIPVDAATSQMAGFAIVEVADAQMAARFIDSIDGFRLDKAHRLAAASFDCAFNEILTMSDKFDASAATEAAAVIEERPFSHEWLIDTSAKSQFFTLHWEKSGNAVNATRFVSATELSTFFKRQNMADLSLEWSRHGSYLVSFHKPGIALWIADMSTDSFERVTRLAHPHASISEFSAEERVVLTVAVESPSKMSGVWWEVATGRRIFDIAGSPFDARFCPSSEALFFVLRDGVLELHRILFDEKRVEKLREVARSVVAAEWSPKRPQLAFWIAEAPNSPARVCIWDAGVRGADAGGSLLKSKTLFNVKDCKFFWSVSGNHLGVVVDRWHKNKKTFSSAAEIFRVRVRDVPVDNVEFPPSYAFADLAWDPLPDGGENSAAERFLVVLREPDSPKSLICVYTHQRARSSGLDIYAASASFERRSLDRAFWSPNGKFVAFCNAAVTTAGNFEVWNAVDLALLSAAEHALCTDWSWDPSGVYFASVCSVSRAPSAEHGFVIWDSKGAVLARKSIDKFDVFAWRPRPRFFIDEAAIDAVRRNIKMYARTFDDEDNAESIRAKREERERRSRIVVEWRSWRRACRERYASDAAERLRICGVDPLAFLQRANERLVQVEEIVEELVDEQRIKQ